MKKLVIALVFVAATNAFAVTCRNFSSQAEAQRYHDSKNGRTRLDRDRDGEACECLPGGSKYGSSICNKK